MRFRPHARLPSRHLLPFVGLCALVGCAQAQTPSGVGGDGLDRAEATNALGAIDRTTCSDAAGPRGKGELAVHVIVVFAPEGHVLEASFDDGDRGLSTAIAKTPRGACIAERLKDLHVPPFKGKPTKVGRFVTLE
ncbi:MAG: hypothetical protein JST00_17720 [Deltaproteobacteria bacterium]|nr:hypothetical protein [Deltaproteobacteria bacterium]